MKSGACDAVQVKVKLNERIADPMARQFLRRVANLALTKFKVTIYIIISNCLLQN
jgi:hypothetical protein